MNCVFSQILNSSALNNSQKKGNDSYDQEYMNDSSGMKSD
jgi:hypothetical protein